MAANFVLGLDLNGRTIVMNAPETGIAVTNTTPQRIMETTTGDYIYCLHDNSDNTTKVYYIYNDEESPYNRSLLYNYYESTGVLGYPDGRTLILNGDGDRGVISYLDEESPFVELLTRTEHEKTYLVTEDYSKVEYKVFDDGAEPRYDWKLNRKGNVVELYSYISINDLYNSGHYMLNLNDSSIDIDDYVPLHDIQVQCRITNNVYPEIWRLAILEIWSSGSVYVSFIDDDQHRVSITNSNYSTYSNWHVFAHATWLTDGE